MQVITATNGDIYHIEAGALIYSKTTKFSFATEKWFSNGALHRGDSPNDSLPAYVEYYEKGAVLREWWYQNGKKHRGDGSDDSLPAEIYYYENGTVASESWYQNGKEMPKPVNKPMAIPVPMSTPEPETEDEPVLNNKEITAKLRKLDTKLLKLNAKIRELTDIIDQ